MTVQSARLRKLTGEAQQSAGKIGKILEMVQGFSDQTNLLALNAAIEAARAVTRSINLAANWRGRFWRSAWLWPPNSREGLTSWPSRVLTSLIAATNRFLLQTYIRDTGEILNDLSITASTGAGWSWDLIRTFCWRVMPEVDDTREAVL